MSERQGGYSGVLMESLVGHFHLAHFFGLARVLFQFFFWLFHLAQRRRTVNPPVPVYSF